MVAAVRGFAMEVQGSLVTFAGRDSMSTCEIADAFGFSDSEEYLAALGREGPRIVERMRWAEPS